jgi:hypothetical protein
MAGIAGWIAQTDPDRLLTVDRLRRLQRFLSFFSFGGGALA